MSNNFDKKPGKEALYYNKSQGQKTTCVLCPHTCHVESGKAGLCRVRKNEKGTLYTLNYGEVTSAALDPIEKKPLYHFHPGSTTYSLGTYGCNFHCQFCQNWQISQGNPPTRFFTPQKAVDSTLKYKKTHDCIGISFTYSEPIVWYEYVRETAQLSQEHGLKNILVTNGFINNKPLEELMPFIDAVNVDLKAFTPDFYQEVSGGMLEPVKETIAQAIKHCHMEITVLLIPTLNDSKEEIEKMVDWIASIDSSIPLHFSRYQPQYKMRIHSTPPETLEMAREIAREKLSYVYIGNVSESKWCNTYCPSCGEKLIGRDGGYADVVGLEDGNCRFCGMDIHIEF